MDFRVDAIHHLIEDVQLRDNPLDPEWQPGMSPARRLMRVHSMDQPEVHDAIADMRRVADKYGGRLMIGEAYLPIDRLTAYYGVDLSGFQLPFNFHLISTPWRPDAIARLIGEYEAALPAGGWPNWVLGNHDRSRLASRLGPQQARVAAMLLLTLRGTPTIYQGEEIGMVDVPIPAALAQDPWEKNVPGLGLGRDPVRTPMPWSRAANGGFSEGTPWLPVDTRRTIDVERQIVDRGSSLSLYRRLLHLRKTEPALSIGSYVEIAQTESVLVYQRRYGSRQLQIMLNMGDTFREIPAAGVEGTTLLSTFSEAVSPAPGRLRPHEGRIVAI